MSRHIVVILCSIGATVFLGRYDFAMARSLMCGPRAQVVGLLQTRHKESLHAIGVVSKSLLIEVFTSSFGGWTILMTTPQGRSCVAATGKSWEDFPFTKKNDQKTF